MGGEGVPGFAKLSDGGQHYRRKPRAGGPNRRRPPGDGSFASARSRAAHFQSQGLASDSSTGRSRHVLGRPAKGRAAGMTIAVSDGWRGAWLLRWRGISAGTCEPAAYPLPRSAPRFGNRLRLYLDPWPSGPDARRDAHLPRRAQGLSSGLLRQATSSYAGGRARRGADTAIPSHGSLRDRSQGISLDWVSGTLRPLTRLPH